MSLHPDDSLFVDGADLIDCGRSLFVFVFNGYSRWVWFEVGCHWNNHDGMEILVHLVG